MISPGTLVAGYRIERVLGTGGMGTVYAARNPRLPRLDALKILGTQLSADADFRTRFQREADIAATLDHPNIVSIYDRGETSEGQLWIAMQLVDGIDAEQALHRGQMNPHRAVDIIAEVAEALDYAHRRGVVHRDVKPANFLISALEQADERALLADFGIARAVDDAGLTGTTAVMATAAFAAPEVTSGSPADARSDLYSLGVSLFRLLTGQSPYAGAGSSAAQILAHLREPPPRVSDTASWLPRGFDDVIATAMAKDPAKRYASARELADAAASALRQSASRPEATERTVPASTVSSEMTQVSAPPNRAHGAPDDRRPAPKQRRRTVLVVGAAAVLAVAAIIAVVATQGGDDHPNKPDASTRVSATPLIVPPAPQVADSDLPGLLPTAEQVSTIMGAQLTLQPPVNYLSDDGLSAYPDRCISVLLPVEKLTYGNTGSVAAVWQSVTDNDQTINAISGVVSFPSPESAAAFVARQSSLWQQCADTEFTLYGDKSAQYGQRKFTLGAPPADRSDRHDRVPADGQAQGLPARSHIGGQRRDRRIRLPRACGRRPGSQPGQSHRREDPLTGLTIFECDDKVVAMQWCAHGCLAGRAHRCSRFPRGIRDRPRSPETADG